MEQLEYRLDIMDALEECGFPEENLLRHKHLTKTEIQALKDYRPVSMRTLSKLCWLLDRDIDEVIGMPNPNKNGDHIRAVWVSEELEHFPGSNRLVLEFIQDAVTRIPGKEHTIVQFFSQGYCYYFALMLQHNFGGTICVPGCRGHVVWVDGTDPDTDIAYDVYGVYDNYDPKDIDNCLIPVDFFGPLIYDMLHSPAKDAFYSESADFEIIKHWYDDYRKGKRKAAVEAAIQKECTAPFAGTKSRWSHGVYKLEG